MLGSKCKICRRAGEKLFLKGDKCLSQKCAFLRRPTPPGQLKKKGKTKRVLTEYGKEMKEVRKLKKTYRIKEKSLKRIIKEVLKKRKKEDVSLLLIQELEKMLFNVIFRTGLAKSREGARQLVSHRHFILRGRRVNIPTIKVRIGDEIKIYEKSKEKPVFKNIFPLLKKENVPSWFSFDNEKKIIKVVGEPTLKDAGVKINTPLILSFYSK